MTIEEELRADMLEWKRFLQSVEKPLPPSRADSLVQHRGTSFEARIIPPKILPPAPFVPPVDGVFEGDAVFDPDPVFTAVVDNPFAFIITAVEWSAATQSGRVNTGWGPQGEGEILIAFNEGDGITVDGPYVDLVMGDPPKKYHCNQAVPALGFVQFNYADPPPPVSFHYKIFYTIP